MFVINATIKQISKIKSSFRIKNTLLGFPLPLLMSVHKKYHASNDVLLSVLGLFVVLSCFYFVLRHIDSYDFFVKASAII